LLSVMPFHVTLDEETKPVPVIVNWNAPSPSGTWLGESDDITGAG